MAIQNNKYNNSFIYTIRSPYTDKFYIGSTTQILCRRFSNHKTDYNSYVNNGFKGFITSFKIIELGDSYIELLEQINCDTKTQLEMREGELIRIHKDLCINKMIAGRTHTQYRNEHIEEAKQYRLDNAKKIKENMKQYRLDNFDKLKEQKKEYLLKNNNMDKMKQYEKQYRLDNAEQIKQRKKQYTRDNVEKIKQYRIDNADKIKQKNKQYYLNKKTPKINITKDDYDLFIYCDKLMNLQYSYKHFIIVE